MTRVKRGFVSRKRHKKTLALTKGCRGSSSRLFRPANQRKMKLLTLAYIGRRHKKRDFRRLWITRLNAAARQYGLSYSKLVFNCNQLSINMNRKCLSQLCIRDQFFFYDLLNQLKQANY